MGRSGALGSKESEAGRYILVVDDEDDIRCAIEEILRDEGFATVAARHGAQALELLRSSIALPRLILLDLMMPEMDGWEFLSRIDDDARLHHIPVALMSAHDSVKRALDKHREDERSMRLLFPKRMNLLRLMSTVRHFCSDAPVELDHKWETIDDESLSIREAPTANFRPLKA